MSTTSGCPATCRPADRERTEVRGQRAAGVGDNAAIHARERGKPWSDCSPDQGFLWWRGQDLNLRPSGYELRLVLWPQTFARVSFLAWLVGSAPLVAFSNRTRARSLRCARRSFEDRAFAQYGERCSLEPSRHGLIWSPVPHWSPRFSAGSTSSCRPQCSDTSQAPRWRLPSGCSTCCCSNRAACAPTVGHPRRGVDCVGAPRAAARRLAVRPPHHAPKARRRPRHIGPGGVFAVETKFRADCAQARAWGELDQITRWHTTRHTR